MVVKYSYFLAVMLAAALLYLISDEQELQAVRMRSVEPDETTVRASTPLTLSTPMPTSQPIARSTAAEPTAEPTARPTAERTTLEPTAEPTQSSTTVAIEARELNETITKVDGESNSTNSTTQQLQNSTSNNNSLRLAVPEGSILTMPPEADPKPVQVMLNAFLPSNGSTTFIHDNTSRPVSECPATSQIQADLEKWTISTYTADGIPKSVGGDDLFFQYEDSMLQQVTAVAFVTDHSNGTYSLNFTSHPFLPQRMEDNSLTKLAPTGRLVVWLEYTCGAGRIFRPFKDHWNAKGAILTQWIAKDVPMPPIHTFIPPTDPSIDFGNIRSLLAVGDSVMQQFVAPSYNNFYYKNTAFGKNNRDAFLERNQKPITQKIRQKLNAFRGVHNNSGLLLGMAAWELQKPFGNTNGTTILAGQPYADSDLFVEHVNCLRKTIRAMKVSFETTCRFFWKSGLYLHLHVVARDKGDEWATIVDRLDYMSDYRTRHLYEEQKKVMEWFNVPVLELLDASFLMPDMHRSPGDAMHYSIEANRLMLSWFYPHGLNETMYL